MKTAISVSRGRIAPVLDVSYTFIIMDDQEKIEVALSEDINLRAEELAALGVNTLVCGAASGFAENIFLSRGIALIPFICGDLGPVMQGLESGEPLEERFLMPGCCGRRGEGGFRSRMRGAGCRRRGMGRGGR